MEGRIGRTESQEILQKKHRKHGTYVQLSELDQELKDIADQEAQLVEVVQERVHQLSLPTLHAKLLNGPSLAFLSKRMEEQSCGKSLRDLSLHFDYHVDIHDRMLGPIVFVTPDYGTWSSTKEAGIMVDQLSQVFSGFGEDVYVIAPYYQFESRLETPFQGQSSILHSFNVNVQIIDTLVEVRVFEGVANGVHAILLQSSHIASPLPAASDVRTTAEWTSTLAKAALEVLAHKQLSPSVIITNDWRTSLVSAYAKAGYGGPDFESVTYLHIDESLEPCNSGVLSVDRADRDWCINGALALPLYLFANSSERAVNFARCAHMSCDQWATSGQGYRNNLLESPHLKPHLKRHRTPFAFPLGINVEKMTRTIHQAVPIPRPDMKRALQKKFFGVSDASVPLLVFSGPITADSDVELLCSIVPDLVRELEGRVHIVIGGKADWDDDASAVLGGTLLRLRRDFSDNVWANPGLVFADDLVSKVGADFGLVLSRSGRTDLSHLAYLCVGTPVIASAHGQVADTVVSYDHAWQTGNGFVVAEPGAEGLLTAILRAVNAFADFQLLNRLRENAQASALDASMSGWAWLAELYRLKNRADEFVERIAGY